MLWEKSGLPTAYNIRQLRTYEMEIITAYQQHPMIGVLLFLNQPSW